METLAAVEILRQHFPALKIRVINVVDLMTLQSQSEHPHGLSDEEFDVLFTKDKPIIFAYHGYPLLIHKLTYRRANHHNLHVHGFKEEGTTTTPFDMVVLNELDRFHLARAVIDRVPGLGASATLAQFIGDKLIDHKRYIRQHGEDMPEIRNGNGERMERGPRAPSAHERRYPSRGPSCPAWRDRLEPHRTGDRSNGYSADQSRRTGMRKS
jgi:xylulose-5-phosphate/fructose-6-phosphate phosphoketolase